MRGVCPDFYFACTRETRATPQSHDDNDNGDDNCNENDNLCAIVHREVKPPQKRLAPAQTTFHAPFRPRARRNPTTPAWAGTHRTPTTFEWPRWRQAVFRRPRVRRGSLPARTCIPVLWSRNPTEDEPVGYTYDVRGGWPLTVVDAFHRGCLPPPANRARRRNPTTASRVAMGIANDLSSDGRPRQHAPNVMRGRLNPTTRVVRAQGSTTQTRTSTPRSRIRTTHPRQLPREPRTWPQSDTNTALCLPLPGVLPLAAPATPRRRFSSAATANKSDCYVANWHPPSTPRAMPQSTTTPLRSD